MKMAHDHGMQIAIHCIGDAALNQALTCMSAYREKIREQTAVDGIVHCQIMDEAHRTDLKNRIYWPTYSRFSLNPI